MLPLTAGLPVLSSDLFLYYTRDPLLENLPILIFYGPSTTGNTTQNSSRIQSYVCSLAGFLSFPRLTVAPTSPLYAAVNHLPSEFQGDEVYRGLAVSLLSYFAALSPETKTSLRSLAGSRRSNGIAPMMFDEMHAGDLAAKMEQVEPSGPVLEYLTSAIIQQSLSWFEMDVKLPARTMKRITTKEGDEEIQAFDENGLPLFEYGHYSSVIKQLGTPAFLPTSKLKRAHSRPTPHSRTRVLSKDAKIGLRRELCELVDTENTYLGKLNELVSHIVVAFRKQTDFRDVDVLFPESLDQIAKLNEGFYDEIQSILDATEDEAIRDIESISTSEPRSGSNGNPSKREDPTGATTFSLAMLKWFPKFLGPYQNYLRASTHFAQILVENMSDASSQFASKVSNIGEQHLRSALIEPVQRLPRYSLLIDNMVNLLPSSHPALSSLLKARDIITQICTLDATTASEGSILSRTMSKIVQNWPPSLSLTGRLITAIDVVELDPPYDPANKGNPGVILLLQDRLVLLDKLAVNGLSARGIMAEVDRPTMQAQIDQSLTADNGEKTLGLSETFELSKILITQSNDGRLIHLTDLASAHPSIQSTTHFKIFCLQGSYENKAARVGEEVAKARIEGTYAETIRDGGKWALRSLANPQELSILFALSENCQTRDVSSPKPYNRISLSIGDKGPAVPASGANINAHIVINDSKMCHLSIETVSQGSHKTDCTIENVSSLMIKQVGKMLKREHEQLIDYQTSYYRAVLKSLPIHEHQAEVKTHNSRPISPMKLLSKVFSGDVGLSRSPLKSSREMAMGIPSIPQPSPTKEKANVDVNSDLEDSGSKVTLVDATNGTYKSPLALLEDTFITYVIALRSRCGNVVGKVLRNRAAADELAVNELYNTLLEDPSRVYMAAEASVDVLFAAFEKFLRVAWRERMGPLVTPMAIQNLQSSLDKGRPTLFAQDFKNFLEEMPPQSRRCFAAMVKLLLELLDASGNDGDRGVLIVSFAEALVLVGNPHDYITLLDRLVDDFDHLFEDAIDKPASSGSATGSLTGSRSINTGSFGSNTSSFRRKFGFGGGLSRENSKNESESKVASIWRTMSKSAKSPGDSELLCNSQPGVISKASLVRSRSTDAVSRVLPQRRPDSRDRPAMAGSGLSDEFQPRPGSSHNTIGALSTIGEVNKNDENTWRKKKRRSSLSDLVDLKDGSALPLFSPSQPRDIPPRASSIAKKTASRTPSPRKTSRNKRPNKTSPRSNKPDRPTYPQEREKSPLGAASKENSPLSRSSPAKKHPMGPAGEVTITSSSPQKRTASRSNILAPKTGGLSERAWPPNTYNTPPEKPTPETSPQKLRIQSPQKLRQRLSQEQKAAAENQSDLQEELNKIAQELSTFKLRTHTSTTPSTSTKPRPDSPQSLDALSTRLDTLSQSLQTFTDTHTATAHALRTDIDSALLHADSKACKLDELYREANAENEALYDRFNSELEKVLGRVRKGEGVEEMRERMTEAVREVAALKSERAKLVRELVGLRSLVVRGGG